MYACAHKIRATNRPRGYSLKFSGKSVANTVKSFVKISVSPYTRARAHNIQPPPQGARSSLSSHTSRYGLRVHNTHTYKLCTHTIACKRTFREIICAVRVSSQCTCVRVGVVCRGLAMFTGRPTCVRHTRAPFIQLQYTTRYTSRNTLYMCNVGQADRTRGSWDVAPWQTKMKNQKLRLFHVFRVLL